jgi:hypothetical protein
MDLYKIVIVIKADSSDRAWQAVLAASDAVEKKLDEAIGEYRLSSSMEPADKL